MRGFRERMLVRDVWAWIDERIKPLHSESCPTTNSHGRVLAGDIQSKMDVPPFNRSAMDGYALQADQTVGAGDYNPIAFQFIGESFPGQPFLGEVARGHCVRIMTGAPCPLGVDAVVPAEFAILEDKQVHITQAVTPGKHVGLAGEDIRKGDKILNSNRRLRPQDVGLLASVGVTEVEVIRQPKIRLVITGNELVQPGETRSPYQIFDSNSVMLQGLVERDGGMLESCIHISDDCEAVRTAIISPGADVVLVSGGSSVGAEDFAPVIVVEEGELPIHGIAMRPSSPTGLGRVGESTVVLLPGNPVSCLCAYDFFAGRIIRRLGGSRIDWPYSQQMYGLQKKIVSAIGRLDYCRVRIHDDGVTPLAISGASILSSTTQADGFVIVPTDSEGFGPGEKVTVYLYDSWSRK